MRRKCYNKVSNGMSGPKRGEWMAENASLFDQKLADDISMSCLQSIACTKNTIADQHNRKRLQTSKKIRMSCRVTHY